MFNTVFFFQKKGLGAKLLYGHFYHKLNGKSLSPNLYMFHVEYFSQKGLDICCLLVLTIDL